jgi:peptidoglycan/LPS O-acetylase OafA/YrhL
VAPNEHFGLVLTHYVKGIDGLRAIAVVAVLAFHAFPAVLPGGFVGVDVFFVISGFIITRTYYDGLCRGGVALRRFYAKRVRRLAPVYLFVLVIATAAACLLLPPPLLKKFSVSLAAQPLYGQNITFWLEGDYFDKPLTRPLLHTWSLAVEEQFYLGYGLLILLARRCRRLAVPLLVIASCASYGMAHILAELSAKTAFYWLPTRIWEFGTGVLVARLPPGGGTSTARASRIVGILLIAGAMLGFGESARFPGPQSVAACLGSALALWSLSSGSLASPLLEHPVMTYLGRTSYSLYLWHWPIIAIAATRLGRILTTAEAVAALVATVALAHWSYKNVEEPFRRGICLPADRKLIAGSAVAGIALLAIAVVLHASDGAVGRYSPEVARLYRAQQERSPYRCSMLARIRSYPAEVCRINGVAGGEGILVLGDSHADQLDEVIAAIGARQGVPVFLTTRNCSLAEFGPGVTDKAYCDRVLLDRLGEDIKRYGIRYVVAISSLGADIDEAALQRTVDVVLGFGLSRLFITHTVPASDYFDPRTHIRAIEGGGAAPNPVLVGEHQQSTKLQRDALSTVAQRSPQITLLDPAPFLCQGEVCPFERNGKPVYFDSNHLSPSGAALLEPMFERALEAARNGKGESGVGSAGGAAPRVFSRSLQAERQ